MCFKLPYDFLFLFLGPSLYNIGRSENIDGPLYLNTASLNYVLVSYDIMPPTYPSLWPYLWT